MTCNLIIEQIFLVYKGVRHNSDEKQCVLKKMVEETL